MAKACALCRAFDEARNVGQHEPAARAEIDDAETGVQRSEGIVGDLRRCGGYHAQEGRFAGIRQTEQARIRDQLQTQPDPAFLALFARIGAAGGLVG